MKDITIEEFYKAPSIVQVVYMQAITKRLTTSTTYELALKLHPEYFPKEIERMQKWEACDKQAYFKEMAEMRDRLYKASPPSPGLLAQANNTNAARVYNEFVASVRPQEIAEEKRINQKYGLL